MAAKGTTFANSLLLLLLNATPYANVADNAASSPFTQYFLSLHTASPGASGNQTTSEAAYTSYARQAVARSSAGWTIASGTATLTSAINFPAATGGTETETFFGLGTLVTGTGQLWYFGPISPTIAVSSGVTPQLTTGSTIQET